MTLLAPLALTWIGLLVGEDADGRLGDAESLRAGGGIFVPFLGLLLLLEARDMKVRDTGDPAGEESANFGESEDEDVGLDPFGLAVGQGGATGCWARFSGHCLLGEEGEVTSKQHATRSGCSHERNKTPVHGRF